MRTHDGVEPQRATAKKQIEWESIRRTKSCGHAEKSSKLEDGTKQWLAFAPFLFLGIRVKVILPFMG